MALDESILDHIGRGESIPTLRLYAWTPACLSLGHAQLFADVDLTRLKQHGWEVVRRATGGRAILHTDELTSMSGRHSGGIDILVNNAGIIRDKLLLSMELNDWDKVMDLNLKGVFLCTRSAVEMMMHKHSGKIVNISSISAIKCVRGQTNYASAKGGIISFTKACAVELAGKNIQVNAVLPGMIVTDMSSRTRKLAGDAVLKSIPAGRFGEPSDVAKMVLFFASELSDYVSGQAISVDGGMTIS